MITEPLDAPVLDINAICGTCGAYVPINEAHGRCGRSAESGRNGVIEAETRACRLHEIVITEVQF
jgi:hypothetical protein